MATEDGAMDTSTVREAIRTVTPYWRGDEDAEMNTIGWAIFLGLVILMVPLLPLIAVVWAISKVFERGARRAS